MYMNITKHSRKQKIQNNIKMDYKEINRRVWIEFIWLRIGTSGGLF
jgi:hypothetical protein